MNFQEFLRHVPKLIQVILPAGEAHSKMAPFERMAFLENLDIEIRNPRKAAVLMLIYPKKGQTHLVLIVRNSYLGVHSSQIAFPGGKYESEDMSYENTALRETHEEIGIHPQKIKIIKTFSQLYIPPSNFMVHPFLGICNEEIIFIPDAKEVAGIIELPLFDFLNDSLVTSTEMITSYAGKIPVPAFKIEEHIVWGATAMMLNELKEVLKKAL